MLGLFYFFWVSLEERNRAEAEIHIDLMEPKVEKEKRYLYREKVWNGK